MERSHSTSLPHHDQATWALSQRVQGWPDRYLLLQLTMMAYGSRRVRASDHLLSGLTGVSTGAVHKALARMERRSILKREHGDDGHDYIALAYPAEPGAQAGSTTAARGPSR